MSDTTYEDYLRLASLEKILAKTRGTLEDLKTARSHLVKTYPSAHRMAGVDATILAVSEEIQRLEEEVGLIRDSAGPAVKYPVQRCGACHKRWIELQRPVWPKGYHTCPYCGERHGSVLLHEVGEYHTPHPIGKRYPGHYPGPGVVR